LKSADFRPAASAEVDEAYLWYENQRQGLGEEFLFAVQNAVDSVLENPEMYPVVRRDTRRVLLNRFPYSLLYRLVHERVVVVACFHAKRDPQRWHSRR
jgi:plasmid stabilization system protein ParE